MPRAMVGSALGRFDVLRRLAVVGLLSLLGAAALPKLMRPFREAWRPTAYGWQDEGFVLGPAMDVYEGGLTAYRCRGNRIVCYGPTQAYLDAAWLRLAPQKWLTSERLVQPPGTPWFFQAELPHAFQWLRFSRALSVVGLCIAMVAVARRRRTPWHWAVACGLSLATFSAFGASWQGLKNDFLAAGWLIAFAMLAEVALRAEEQRKRWFFAALVVGILGSGVKVSLLLPVALFFPAYAWAKRPRARRLLCGALVAVVTYLAINPNFWVSSSEASWFLALLAVSGHAWSAEAFRADLFSSALPCLWPLAAAALCARWGGARTARSVASTVYLFGVPFLFLLLNLKAAWNRPHYYLPFLTWSWIVFFFYAQPLWERERVRARFALGTLLAATAVLSGATLAPWRQIIELNASVAREPLETAFDQAPNDVDWWVDQSLRPAVREHPARAGRVFFFDSLSQTPAEVREAALRDSTNPDKVRVWVACWTEEEAEPGFFTPSAREWLPIAQRHCARSEPFSSRLFYSFENGSRVTAFFMLQGLEELKTASIARIREDRLNPRGLRGAERGIDQWFSPLILYQDVQLTGTFEWPRGLTKVSLRYESTCKDSAILRLRTGEATATASVSVKEATCAQYPLVCRWNLEHWWMKRFPGKLELAVHVSPGARASLQLEAEGLRDPDRCRVSLQPIEWTFSDAGVAAGPSR